MVKLCGFVKSYFDLISALANFVRTQFGEMSSCECACVIKHDILPVSGFYKKKIVKNGTKTHINLLIDCMVFYTVFNIFRLTSQLPVHKSILSWNSFYQRASQYSFQVYAFFPINSSSKQWRLVRGQ